MTLKPGSKLAHYEISAQLGEGGMGEVYRADDSKLGREVAIKVLPADMSSDPERLRRFDQEARAASALNHPNILTVFDLGTEGEAPFIVMELLEGESLRARLAAGTLSVAKVIEIAVSFSHLGRPRQNTRLRSCQAAS
jgi:serine/threonine protein kinase